jgi:orotidine-5'-phosphate decarboxylase
MLYPKEKLIVALDNFGSINEFKKIASELKNMVSYFKVGLELINTKDGIESCIKILKKNKSKIFYDAKLHDIPNTVAKSVKNICKLKVDILTIHSSGGRAMVEAAVKSRNEAKSKMQIFGVTILTSLSDKDTKTIYGKKTKEKVLELALLAKQSGLDGIICSPQELTFLKSREELKGLKFITPGIRPHLADQDEQTRSATPAQAIQSGADQIVVGRPITSSKKPKDAAKKILDEIQKSL